LKSVEKGLLIFIWSVKIVISFWVAAFNIHLGYAGFRLNVISLYLCKVEF